MGGTRTRRPGLRRPLDRLRAGQPAVPHQRQPGASAIGWCPPNGGTPVEVTQDRVAQHQSGLGAGPPAPAVHLRPGRRQGHLPGGAVFRRGRGAHRPGSPPGSMPNGSPSPPTAAGWPGPNSETSQFWSLPVPARDSVPLSRATLVTSGTEYRNSSSRPTASGSTTTPTSWETPTSGACDSPAGRPSS